MTTRFFRMATAALLLSIAACSTTGDPRKGGLIRWDEKKAQSRQQAFAQDRAAAQQQAAREQQRADALQDEQAGLQVQQQRLQVELDRLLQENQALEAHLRQLLRERRLGERELARLRQTLADNQPLLQALPAGDDSAPEIWSRVEAVNSQNERLHREIRALLH